MLGRILGLNSTIHTFNELHFFEHMVDARTVVQRLQWDSGRLAKLLERLLTSARDGFFNSVQAGRYGDEAVEIINRAKHKDPVEVYQEFLYYETHRQGKLIPCEQTPRYLFFLEEILSAFPDARVINMIRDPRDVLISQKNKWKRRFLGAKNIPVKEVVRAWANYHPFLIARLWVSCVRQAHRFRGDSRVMTVRFEDLLDDPEVTVKNLANFIGVTFEREMLQVPHVGSSSGVDNPNQLGINAARARGWRQGGLSRTELVICEWVASLEMGVQGYELAGTGRLQFVALPSMVQLLFKLSLALPLNLSRTKNLMDTVKRRLLAGRPS